MAANENSNKKPDAYWWQDQASYDSRIVFTSKKQVIQFLIEHPDNVIFKGITLNDPYLDLFWQFYGESELSVHVPSFRKWFDQAGLEIEARVEIAWRYTECWSGRHTFNVDQDQLNQAQNKPLKDNGTAWRATEHNVIDLDELVDPYDLSMVTEDNKHDSGDPDGDWELTPKSCHFYLLKSSLEEHEEAA
jgi:hypothetical protein